MTILKAEFTKNDNFPRSNELESEDSINSVTKAPFFLKRAPGVLIQQMFAEALIYKSLGDVHFVSQTYRYNLRQ